jgi:hypothetical protein
MRARAVVSSLVVTASVMTTSVFAQNVTRSFGSVVFPGGTSSTSPSITRNFGSAVFPGGSSVPVVRGGAPPIAVLPPAGFTSPVVGSLGGGQGYRRTTGRNTRTQPYVYAYPVYVGGAYGGGAYDNGYAPQDQPPAPPAQPNVTVVYPPSQHASPVMIQAGPDGEYYSSGQRQGAVVYDAPRTAAAEDQPEPAETSRYLIAFKDHTIYSAVAYWADGDTLHYFTTGSTHNQVSMSLIDRELTERLNREMGTDFKLPAAK